MNGNLDSLRKRRPTDDGKTDISGDASPNPKVGAMDKVNKSAHALKLAIMDHVDKKLHDLIDDIDDQIEQLHPTNMQNNKVLFSSVHYNPRAKKSLTRLPEKQFLHRRSLLTELFESQHILTIYHIFIAILILLFLNTVIYDFVDTGKFKLDFALIRWAFQDIHIVMAIWTGMKLSTILIVYPTFHFWAHNRYLWQRYVDYIWLSLYVVYLALFFYVPVQKVVIYKLPPASSVIVLMEQVRLLMKVHAFVRANIPKALKYKLNKDEKGEQMACPDFSKYLYFLFVPTLVYQDDYPRTAKTNWKAVVTDLLQVVACLFYTYFIFVRFLVPVFQKFGQEPFAWKNLILSLFSCMMPGTLFLLTGFFAILHSWLNAFAEMLRFADRMFYRDWWNSKSFANYYRTWNVVVHDWLYTYAYRDVHELCQGHAARKYLPKIVVFVVSAIVHEYILTLTFRFFYPILLVMFGGVGMLFAFVTDKDRSPIWNIFMWVGLVMGLGLLMSLYSMEWYARINCEPNTDSKLDLFIPRSWYCVPKKTQ